MPVFRHVCIPISSQLNMRLPSSNTSAALSSFMNLMTSANQAWIFFRYSRSRLRNNLSITFDYFQFPFEKQRRHFFPGLSSTNGFSRPSSFRLRIVSFTISECIGKPTFALLIIHFSNFDSSSADSMVRGPIFRIPGTLFCILLWRVHFDTPYFVDAPVNVNDLFRISSKAFCKSSSLYLNILNLWYYGLATLDVSDILKMTGNYSDSSYTVRLGCGSYARCN